MTLNYFFTVFALTILAIRGWLSIWPMHSPTIGNFHLHHYMYGLVMVALYFFIPKPAILAVGLALIVDELYLFFMFRTWNWPVNHWAQYNSWQNLTAIVVISLAGYLALRFFQISRL
ncbi:MAG: hypothetical protein A3J07_00040 [Candidatus Doudnabacteria bacterium RIFCSPLOWO2_02_FULL_49_13]|uniref:Uncharacterized protein n=1 Tax=Candidatus Doudnabacteria bacterium RIFCSPHIGHO2_12_FULL_48_16 TaxID=1817838 RepID=A0A1F5PLV4_9BACT|nr:MAG: hypothetical protein A3B77_00310 [Candidatus Doudnabacteria bacterium RIFCSPHIGHO2_02_FULL_49_24]OGE88260.1 MAG: hypothetical protein A2760_03550 [Candidatus Doudnabacteria bacterium RIFCSPHIGHO2_01_FULL_50_67]OGE90879.1 MAG: hypothetical protein A3E29_01755 [Candidatus Doudnabacteria bacterium RIFCSPHIGHO2_12_FULL_48_16]OGF02285.1 MAG: hypothetical protein A3J07_00040 [Candidatus Doudnabacteria bacterium RIFCSPLOWO2_02_FULL_49_13]OGF03633.1 MAG: hypothetical protein A3H14_02285 [Candid